MKMLSLLKYGTKAASTRQRLLQYRDYFSHRGIDCECFPLLANDYIEKTYRGNRPPIWSIWRSYLNRLTLLRRADNFDLIWIHCEGFPYLPGMAEELSIKTGKPVIYDFDDAIFHQYDMHPNPLIRRLLGRKLEPLMRGASLCVCGNRYLQAYADRFCRRTEIVPTVLDTNIYTPTNDFLRTDRPLTVGWIGSPSTWAFVEPLVPLLRRLSQELDLTIRIVGARRPDWVDSRFEFLDWSEDTEIASIRGMDIGIMPLPDEPWARGKCGYKLIQYMACGIPVVASPVGVNSHIVDDGVHGYLARNEQEWDAAIRGLAANAERRIAMGACGRKRIVSDYSLHVHGPRLANLLHAVVEESRRTDSGALDERCF